MDGEAIKGIEDSSDRTWEGVKIMSFFGRKGKVVDDVPDNSGLVNIGIKIQRKDRSERRVRTVVVEKDTGETVFKTDFSDKRSQSDYGAYVKAEELAKLYCRNMDYVIADTIENGMDKPIVQTVEKRSR